MFTSFLSSPAGGWAAEEYILLSDHQTPWTGNMGYLYNSGSSISYIADMTLPSTSYKWIASDGQMVLTVGTTSGNYLEFHKWNGGTGFTSLGESDVGDGIIAGGLTHPLIAGRLIVPNTEFRSSSVVAYQQESPYGVTQHEVATGNIITGEVMDFRYGDTAGTFDYGSYYGIGTNTLNSESSQIFSLSGNTVSVMASSVSNAGWYKTTQYIGWDRDSHIVVSMPVLGATTTFWMWEVDFATPSIPARQSIGNTTDNAYCVACHNGFIITAEDAAPGNYLRVYSRDGTTLTQVDELEITDNTVGGNGQLYTSPITGYVYHLSALTGGSRCIKLSGSGSITQITGMPNVSNGTGSISNNMRFLASALPSA